jgi:hypothetical protein
MAHFYVTFTGVLAEEDGSAKRESSPSRDSASTREHAERITLKLVGWSFVTLAAYVVYDSLVSLIARQAPERSVPGIVLAVASLIVMPLLAREAQSRSQYRQCGPERRRETDRVLHVSIGDPRRCVVQRVARDGMAKHYTGPRLPVSGLFLNPRMDLAA